MALVSAWGKHVFLSLPLGSNTHTYRIVMISSYGEPRSTYTAIRRTVTDAAAHLVSMMGSTLIEPEFLFQSVCVCSSVRASVVCAYEHLCTVCDLADTEKAGFMSVRVRSCLKPDFHLYYCSSLNVSMNERSYVYAKVCVLHVR